MDTPSFTLGQLHDHLASEIEGTVYPPGRQVQVALASFCIVQEHHVGIAVLLQEGLYASAFALSRALYEATVKGAWIAHCASEEIAEKHALGKELPSVAELIEQLKFAGLPPVVQFHLENVKKKYWKVLSSLTHAGNAQVRRWLSPSGVEPLYSETDIQELVNFTGFFAIVAALERARLGSNDDALRRLLELLPEAHEA